MVDSYNHEYDLEDPALVSAYDELSLWAAPFGLKLLDSVRLRPGIHALDLGCGTGFPFLELAQRLGPSSFVCGIDPWEYGLLRVQTKSEAWNLEPVSLIRSVGEYIPFAENTFDLIVANNGLNNVEDPRCVLNECFRVSKSGAQLVLTMNLPDTMVEFYDVLKEILKEQERTTAIEAMDEQIYGKRKPLHVIENMIQEAGFSVSQGTVDSFTMRFADGTALFQHSFIRMWFLGGWLHALKAYGSEKILGETEKRLNRLAEERGEIILTIPFVCFDCEKR